jgi:hypothetical protein
VEGTGGEAVAYDSDSDGFGRRHGDGDEREI